MPIQIEVPGQGIIEFPDGMTDAQIESAIKANSQQDSVPVKKEQSPVMQYLVNPLNQIAGAVVEPVLSMGSSMVAKPISEIAGMSATGYEMLTGNENPDMPQQFQKDIQQKLTYQPRTELGASEYNPLNAIPQAIGGVIDASAGGVSNAITDNEIARSGLKETLSQAAGIGIAKLQPKVTSAIKQSNLAKQAALLEQKALDRLRNSIRDRGKSIGLIAPAESGLKMTASKLGGVDPHIALKNREIATNKIAEDVGLKKGAISDADITNRIGELAKNYAVVEKALPQKVSINPSFMAEVNNILQPMKQRFAQDPKAFAGYSGAIDLLEQQLRQKEISPAILMDKIKKLRSDARTYDKNPSGKPIEQDLAKSSYDLANIYEDLIESNLAGRKAIIDKFRDSRKQLSQIHIIESSRMADGLLDLHKLASTVGKYSANKKFVTGTISTVSDFANTFKDVTKPIERANFAVPNRWELAMAGSGLLGATTTGGASLVLAAPTAARMTLPYLAERGMLQGKTPSYALSASRKLTEKYSKSGMLGAAFSANIEEQQQ